MLTEKSAGAVVFRNDNGKRYYLLLHYKPDDRRKKLYWAFSKGRIEKGETEEKAAHREVMEETGLTNLNFLKNFKEKSKYVFHHKGKTISKTVTFFVSETKKKKIIISSEHIGFKWLPFKSALRELWYGNDKEILRKAESYLDKI